MPISLKAISLELSILNRVINLRKFNSSPYGNGFLIRYNSNFTQYFSGPRNSPIEVAYGQNVFNPDGSLLIGDRNNPYNSCITSEGSIRKTNVSIRSDILPVYSNDGTLFSKQNGHINTLMIDEVNMTSQLKDLMGIFRINSVHRIENRDGVYVFGSWTDSKSTQNQPTISGTLDKSGWVELHGVKGGGHMQIMYSITKAMKKLKRF